MSPNLAAGMRREVGAGFLGLALAFHPWGSSAALGADGEWFGRHGDALATRRGGVARISSLPEEAPAIAWGLIARSRPMPGVIVRQLGEGGPWAVLMPYQGRVVALDPASATPLWISAPRGIDGILGVADLDGDLAADELIAVSGAVGGGAYVIDLVSGGLLSSVTGLSQRSGVDLSEALLDDLDADGLPEIVFPSAIYNVGDLFAVSWAAGLASPSVLTTSFSGYNNLTPLRSGDFLAPGEASLVLEQGHHYALFDPCSAADAGAVCPASPGGPCLCPGVSLMGVHPSYAFGSAWTVDTDGDGIDELFRVANDPSLLQTLVLLDFHAGSLASTDVPAATRRWCIDHSGASPRTVIRAPLREPLDLDGDGDLDVLVSFFHNDSAEVDCGGTPVSDGIDAMLAYAWGIFDVATGALVASGTDAWAWDIADLDGDGAFEIVTSPTAGDAFLPGLVGFELDCTILACSVQEAWSAPDHSGDPAWEQLGPLSIPQQGIGAFDADGDGGAEIVAWRGETASLIDLGPEDVEVVSEVPLGRGGRLQATPDPNPAVVVSDDANFAVFLPGVGLAGSLREIPPLGLARWNAARLDPGSGRAVPVVDGLVYASVPEPLVAADSDWELLPRFALAADLDGNGRQEFLSFRTSADRMGSGFGIRVDESISPTDWTIRWERSAAEVPGLETSDLTNDIAIAVGRFGGSATLDVVTALRGAAGTSVAFWDGDDGALLGTVPTGTAPGNHSPLIVADLYDASGNLGGDGVDEVIVNGPYLLEVLSIGYGGPVASLVTSHPHVVSAGIDADLDGWLDVVSTTSVNINNRLDLVDLGPGAPATVWGPVSLGPPSGSMEVVSFVDQDGSGPPELVYLNGQADLEVRSLADGSPVPGFPVHILAGQVVGNAAPDAPALRTLLVLDVDDDGWEEVVVGTADGYVSAINVAVDDTSGEPTVEWSLAVGAAVESLAAADLDGDGFEEVLASVANGRAVVVDGLGAQLSIDSPTETECIGFTSTEVRGSSTGIASVRLSASGPPTTVPVGADGSWVGQVQIVGGGEREILAEGLWNWGGVAIVASRVVQFEGDGDGDGVAPCGGDCDDADAARSPLEDERCEDGIDQDCDGADASCPPEPTPEPTPDGNDPGEPTLTCIGCDATGHPGGSLPAWLCAAFLGIRRRLTPRRALRPGPDGPARPAP